MNQMIQCIFSIHSLEVSPHQLKEGLERVGVRNYLVEWFFSNFLVPPEETPLKIFEIDGNPKIEHGFSSAVRDPGPPSEDNFEVIASYADENGRLNEDEMAEMVQGYISAKNDPNPERQNFGGIFFKTAFAALIQSFARDDGKDYYFTVEDLRGLYLEGKYPQNWTVRAWGLFDLLSSIYDLGPLP